MSRASKAILESRECNYYRWDEATWSNFYNFVTSSPTMPAKCNIMPDAALAAEQPKFDGFWWTSYTSRTWSIPFFACVVYVAMLYTLPVYMAKREKLRLQPIVVAWNFGLSFFSLCGLFYCVPHLLFNKSDGFLTQGLYPSVCAHASTYGFGDTGLFVFLFIYSKLFELVDTLWLCLRKSPVIFLHWCARARRRRRAAPCPLQRRSEKEIRSRRPLARSLARSPSAGTTT